VKISIYILLIISLLTGAAKAQDPQFSQFYSNSLYLAPSFAGITGDSRISANYRQQWPEIPGAFNTYSFGFDHFFEAFNSGLGAFILKDQAGSGNLTNISAGVQYSFDFKIAKYWHIRPGAHFYYMQRSIDYQKLIWHDQISPAGNSPMSAEVVPLESMNAVDFSSSILTYSDKYWFGVAVDHLLRPSQSLYFIESKRMDEGYIPYKWSVFGGTKIIKQSKLLRPFDTSLQLAFMYKQQGLYSQLDVGAYFYKKPIVIGLWYRGIPVGKKEFKFNQDATTLLVGYKIDNVSIGYSYDFTISRLIGHTGGSHEVSLTYQFNIKVRERKGRMVPCPDF